MTDPRAIVLRRLRARARTESSLLATLERAGLDRGAAERVLDELFRECAITLETRHRFGARNGRPSQGCIDRVVLTDRGRELGGVK
jgi:hypothetical protein